MRPYQSISCSDGPMCCPKISWALTCYQQIGPCESSWQRNRTGDRQIGRWCAEVKEAHGRWGGCSNPILINCSWLLMSEKKKKKWKCKLPQKGQRPSSRFCHDAKMWTSRWLTTSSSSFELHVSRSCLQRHQGRHQAYPLVHVSRNTVYCRSHVPGDAGISRFTILDSELSPSHEPWCYQMNHVVLYGFSCARYDADFWEFWVLLELRSQSQLAG